MAVAAAREAALNRLVTWCQKKDPQFFLRADCVRAVVDIRSNVHMVATQDIPAKTTLVIIPPSLTIATDTVTHAATLKKDYVELEKKIKELYKGQLVDGDGEAFQPAGEWAGLGRGGVVTKEARSLVQEYRMALAMALELASKDQGSVWQEYLETLPEKLELPLFSMSKPALRACRGTYFHDMLCSEREDFELIMKAVIRPILTRHQKGAFEHKDLEAFFRRAFALQLSRAFEALDDTSVILPVVDCFNGQAEGGGHNVFMVGACQLVSARPIAKGEQLFLNYGRKDNNSFLLAYGHLDDRMVFGNPAHKVCLSLHHLFPLDERFGDATLRRRKLAFLNHHCALAYWQSSYWSNLWMGPTLAQRPGEEAEKAERAKRGEAEAGPEGRMMVPTALRLFSLVLSLRSLEALSAIERSGQFEVDGANCNMELAGRVVLGVIDHHLERLGGGRLGDDVARLAVHAEEGGAGGDDEWLALRVVAGDKNLLLRARREVCREYGWEDGRGGEVFDKLCDHCGTFVGVRRCSHCRVVFYCSKRCQRATWKAHKAAVPAASVEGAKGEGKVVKEAERRVVAPPCS